ncbi:hypothetical protein TREMEDRAFT_34616 [Tremella mesenterica DSM 1558]|nr:uncharacterized protein TREMEDRAFT_34616 [Tremella mesenterica DSM 1558]EIW66665.1 hypothetical protein TREMEDRAFT_34616 [Tremella mesenterica DSM 1558]
MPDGGYGWVMVICFMVINAFTWGANSAYGVFEAYYLKNNYYAGGTTFRYAWVGGLQGSLAMLCSPLANTLMRFIGPRNVMLIGTFLAALGQCMAGVCHTFVGFVFCQGVIFGLGAGLVLIPSQPLLAHWFRRRLALAQGFGSSGVGVGGLILSNTTRAALDSLGVRYTLILNGLLCSALTIPAVLIIRGRHEQLGARSQSLELKWLAHKGFIWVFIWGSMTMLAYYVTLYSIPSYATSALSLTQKQGAALQSILSAGQMIGRPTVGLNLDRFGRINMTILAYIISGISCLTIWLPARSFSVLAVFALIQGLVGGTVWSAAAPIITKVVGIQHLGSALGIFWLGLVPPSLCAQPIAIALLEYSKDHLGKQGPEGYYISIGFAGGVSLAAAGILYGSKVYLQGNWKVFVKT